MKWLVAVCAVAVLLFAGTLSASPLYTQCPAVGANTGCQFLITVNADGSVSIAMDPNPPNNGPYDGTDDTLVGLQNNSNQAVMAFPLSSNETVFGFDNDGPCTALPKPAPCPSSAGFPPDTTGYGGPGVTYSNISADKTSGTVNFSPGIAPGASAWFGLEETLTSTSQIVIGNPTTEPAAVPEPTMTFIIGGSLAVIGLLRRRRM